MVLSRFLRSEAKRRCKVGHKHLNQSIDRPVHPFNACKDILRGIKSDSRWFLKFDAAQGYHQIPLDKESSRLTTFLVESGRYRYTCAPMGLNPSLDHFCSRSDEAFSSVEDLLKIVNNGLLQAPTLPDLLKGFRQVLECCRRYNLTLSRPKLQIGQSVIFAGYEISKDGVKPEAHKTCLLYTSPSPRDRG